MTLARLVMFSLPFPYLLLRVGVELFLVIQGDTGIEDYMLDLDRLGSPS
jgi:hypothetical protein